MENGLAVLVEAIDKPVKPGSHAQRGLGHLDLDNGESTLGIAARGDVGVVEDLGVHVVAGPFVGVAGPDQGASVRPSGVGAGHPVCSRDEEVVLSDARHDVLEERLEGVVAEGLYARELVDDGTVPDLPPWSAWRLRNSPTRRGIQTACRFVVFPAKVTGKKFPPAAMPLTCNGWVMSPVKCVTNLTALAQVGSSP